MKHGRSAYVNHRCRCLICTSDHREWMAEYRLRLKQTPFDKIPHGDNGYSNYHCRCPVCGEAHAAINRVYRSKKK